MKFQSKNWLAGVKPAKRLGWQPFMNLLRYFSSLTVVTICYSLLYIYTHTRLNNLAIMKRKKSWLHLSTFFSEQTADDFAVTLVETVQVLDASTDPASHVLHLKVLSNLVSTAVIVKLREKKEQEFLKNKTNYKLVKSTFEPHLKHYY